MISRRKKMGQKSCWNREGPLVLQVCRTDTSCTCLSRDLQLSCTQSVRRLGLIIGSPNPVLSISNTLDGLRGSLWCTRNVGLLPSVMKCRDDSSVFHRTQSRKMQRHLLHDAGVLPLGKKTTQTRKSSAKCGWRVFCLKYKLVTCLKKKKKRQVRSVCIVFWWFDSALVTEAFC